VSLSPAGESDEPTVQPSSILESITDAFAALDRDWRYVWVNAEAERLMGKTAAEVLGRSLWEVFPETGDHHR
jgi:PAS domain S-box-containing protein